MKLPNIFKRRRAGSLNLAIAKTHRVSNRLVGMQLTMGNFIALALSAAQMSIGFIFLCVDLIKGQPLMYVMIAIIGVALGILIERLSLAGLMGIRRANEKIEAESTGYYARLRKIRTMDASPEEKEIFIAELKEQHEKELKSLVMRRNLSIPVAAVGMILSTSIGDLFWHKIFSEMKPAELGVAMSLACACVIGLTFVYSELFKTIMDDSLEGIVKDNNLDRATVIAERESTQIGLMISSFDGLKKDEKKMRPVENQIRDALVTDLQEFARQVSEGIDVLNDGKRRRRSSPNNALPAPSGRNLYRDNKDRFVAYMTEYPNADLEEIAREFGITESGASKWRTRYLDEKPIEAEIVDADPDEDM
jgi:hypothetical protein